MTRLCSSYISDLSVSDACYATYRVGVCAVENQLPLDNQDLSKAASMEPSACNLKCR